MTRKKSPHPSEVVRLSHDIEGLIPINDQPKADETARGYTQGYPGESTRSLYEHAEKAKQDEKDSEEASPAPADESSSQSKPLTHAATGDTVRVSTGKLTELLHQAEA